MSRDRFFRIDELPDGSLRSVGGDFRHSVWVPFIASETDARTVEIARYAKALQLAEEQFRQELTKVAEEGLRRWHRHWVENGKPDYAEVYAVELRRRGLVP